MKVLCTGGAGFIGSHLVDKLQSAGYDVWVIDDLSGGSKSNLPKTVPCFQHDLRDLSKVEEVMKIIRPEIIFHLASNAAEGKSHFCPVDITTRNYNTFLNVLVAGLNNGMKRIVVTSSVAVYGKIEPPFKENDTPEPEDLYGLSKLEMEKTLKILSKVHSFEYVIARPHNVYGPKQSMRDPYRNVVMIWMNNILNGKQYTIYGDGSMKRCYTYIDDLIDGLYKLGFEDVNKEIFNLGADEAISLKELSDAIQEVSGHVVPPAFLPARAQEVNTAVLDHTKAKEKLGYKTRHTLLEGIKETWEWAKTQGPQELKYTDYEIESDKIPANWRKP